MPLQTWKKIAVLGNLIWKHWVLPGLLCLEPWVGLPLPLSMAWMVVNFFTLMHMSGHLLMLSWVQVSRLECGDILRSKAEPIMLSVDGWDPRIPTSFPVMKFISRGKTAVRVQANWDWSQLFLLDAKSQMYTHSSLPLPKTEVLNFIKFINNFAKNTSLQAPFQRIWFNEFRLTRKSVFK